MLWIVGRGLYAINLIRALEQRIHPIGLITTDSEDPAAYCRQLSRVVYLKSPRENENYVEEVKRVIGEDPCLPVGEETLYLGQISPYCCDEELLRRFHHKGLFLDLISSYPWRPKTRSVEEIKLDEIEEDECLLKPVYSRGMLRTLIKKNGIVRDRTGKIVDPKTTLRGEWLVQQYLGDPTPTNHLSSFTYTRDGEIMSHLVYQGSEAVYGFSSRRQLVQNEEIDRMIEKMVRDYRLSGFFGCDFIMFEGHPYVIECNPRITNGISFYNNISLDNRSTPDVTEVISLLPYLKSKEWEWGRCWKSKKDLWCWWDPSPWLYSAYQVGRLALQSWWQGESLVKRIEDKVINAIVAYPA